LSQGGFMSAVQDLLVTPVWMALLWAVHAMVVMLEWGFAIDLLDSPVGNGLGAGLRRMQDEITDPILPLVLAVAAVLTAYQGIVRRRVSRAVGEIVVMGVMMAVGIWVAGNPIGTVGALGAWANEASFGALAVGARGCADSHIGRADAGHAGIVRVECAGAVVLSGVRRRRLVRRSLTP